MCLSETMTQDGFCSGRVVIVTGAGQGLGRAHALAFAEAGAQVVVNDYSADAAQGVADEIAALHGSAPSAGTPTVSVCAGDVSDWEFAAHLIDHAITTHGGLDTLVNNAGINRDRMLVSLTEAEWDDVIRVNLKGHLAPLRHAAAWWRDQAKAGHQIKARVVNTSSGAGLMGSVGQGNYGASKAGIAALTVIAGVEMARYGIAVNAIAPSARTPMTEGVFAEMMRKPDTGFDAMDPANVSAVVVWLGSDACTITGRVLEVAGGEVSLADGWQHGIPARRDRRWEPAELTDAVADLVARSPQPAPVYGA